MKLMYILRITDKITVRTNILTNLKAIKSSNKKCTSSSNISNLLISTIIHV